MKIRLSSRDIELICFIGRYKQIKSVDCKKIYKSKDYYKILDMKVIIFVEIKITKIE